MKIHGMNNIKKFTHLFVGNIDGSVGIVNKLRAGVIERLGFDSRQGQASISIWSPSSLGPTVTGVFCQRVKLPFCEANHVFISIVEL
jgi:hypothetical protein